MTQPATTPGAAPAALLDEAAALRLDAADPVPSLRDRFEIPVASDGGDTAYLVGHSLGALPRAGRAAVLDELDAWSRLGVRGHFRPTEPWFSYSDLFAAPLARLVGARESEVVVMNTLTINLHVLFGAFYRPTPERYKVLIEATAFASDRWAVMEQLRLHGVDRSEGLLVVEPRPGEDLLRTEDIEAVIAANRGSLALVWLPAVQFVTGQVLDMERLTAAGHAAGAIVGWDLAHAAGNIPMRLHDWGADLAVWGSYKYLNGGPGAIGGAFVHEKWGTDPSLVRLAGWWGNDPGTRFDMAFDFVPRPGAAGWQASNPPVLAMAPLKASLALFDEVGIDRLRERSVRLTAALERELLATGLVDVVTPSDPAWRGAMLCLRLRATGRGKEIEHALAERGVLVDFRKPDILRMAPAPLYNTFHDVWRLAGVLREVAA
ncbi:MAG: kynureninase [Chloroflexota bacterium]